MIRIGNALVSLERREVLLDGKPMLLGGRAFEVLATLIRAKGRVVDKEELFSQVWAGTVVEDNNLQVQVSLLRKAFGDRGLIQTVPRRGYRLAAEISFAAPGRALGALPLCAGADTPQPQPASLYRLHRLAAGARTPLEREPIRPRRRHQHERVRRSGRQVGPYHHAGLGPRIAGLQARHPRDDRGVAGDRL